VKRNGWKVLVVALALFLLWVSEHEERQGMDVVCQSSVLPGYADSIEAPALRDAGMDRDCEPVASASGVASWEPIPGAGEMARRFGEYLSPSH